MWSHVVHTVHVPISLSLYSTMLSQHNSPTLDLFLLWQYCVTLVLQ